MYIIVTYGRKNMKGVQVRGLRIASCLSKHEVLFVNDGDSLWLKEKGYKVIDLALNQFLPQNYVEENIFQVHKPKAIIFADIPSNRIAQTILLSVANQHKIPSIVFDNLYSHKQLTEKVYANTLTSTDHLFLNGLSVLQSDLPEKVTIIPPFVSPPTNDKIEYWKKQLSLEDNTNTVITFLAYNAEAQAVIKKIIDKVGTSKKIKLIISNLNSERVVVKDNLVELPFLDPDDISSVIQLSDIVVGKMGYLQFLESLALKKIFVSVGSETGFRKYWLDNKLQEVCFHFDDYSEKLVQLLHQYIVDDEKKKELVDKISKLHDGSFFDSRKIGELMKTITFQQKKLPKNLLLYVGPGENHELEKVNSIMNQESFILPLIFYRGKDGHEEKKLTAFSQSTNKMLLDSSFYLLSYFSSHSFHSLTQVYPWEMEYVSVIHQLIKKADRVFVIGSLTKDYFQTMLSEIPPEKVKIA